MKAPYTRRQFLGRAALGAAAWFAGFPRRLTWAAPGPAGPSLRLAFFTDVHARTEWDTPAAMRKAAAAINARQPDLVIAGGDLITDGFDAAAEDVAPRWDVYMEMHRAIDAPVHAAMGNHDLVAASPKDGSAPAADPRAIFRERLGVESTYRSFDAGGYHFILLDSVHITGGDLPYEGLVGAGQLEWLKGDLSAHPVETPIVLVTHVPLRTGFYEATKGATAAAPRNRVVVNSVDVLDLFRGRSLPLVLQGHLHVEEMLKFQNTMFVTGGAVCGKWWRGPWHGTEEGFGLITLTGSRVDWEYVDYGWDAQRPVGK